jgi:hypothetical protein
MIDVHALVVACLDVGSATNTGWAVLSDGRLRTGTDIETFAVKLVEELRMGRSIALGFECPLYVPVRANPVDLLQQREGERGRPWSASAGATVLVAGLAQIRWLMSKLKQEYSTLRGTTRWSQLIDGESQLLLWEAFVSSEGSLSTVPAVVLDRSVHERDAAIAVEAFFERVCADAAPESDLMGDGSALSLAGVQLIAAHLTEDLSLLHETCTVVKVGKARRPS